MVDLGDKSLKAHNLKLNKSKSEEMMPCPARGALGMICERFCISRVNY